MYILGYIYYLKHTMAGGLPAQPAVAGPGVFAGLGALLRALLAAVADWRAQYRAERDLAGLPDWALKDIGVARGEIAEVAETLARRGNTGPTRKATARVYPFPARPSLAGYG